MFAVGRPLRPPKQAKPKKSGTKTGPATGGLKRKSMDEEIESEKIRQLEARMSLFEGKGAGTPLEDRSPLPHPDLDESASSDSDDSGSGSESE